MPNPPNLDGLPFWLQILITIVFGLTTALVAAKGYLRPPSERGAAMLTAQPGRDAIQQVHSAVIADMGAIRNLSDVCIRLSTQMEALEQAVRDETHWLRNQHELDREICARLRELREVMERAGRT